MDRRPLLDPLTNRTNDCGRPASEAELRPYSTPHSSTPRKASYLPSLTLFANLSLSALVSLLSARHRLSALSRLHLSVLASPTPALSRLSLASPVPQLTSSYCSPFSHPPPPSHHVDCCCNVYHQCRRQRRRQRLHGPQRGRHCPISLLLRPPHQSLRVALRPPEPSALEHHPRRGWFHAPQCPVLPHTHHPYVRPVLPPPGAWDKVHTSRPRGGVYRRHVV